MIREPTDCATMEELRAEIDRIDAATIALLARRALCIDQAIVLKRAAGWPARIEARVEEVAARARAAAEAQGLDGDFTEDLWRRIIDWSIARETRALDGEERE